MAINFPNSPSPGNTYAYNSIIWSWNGAAWDRQSTNVVGVTGATGPQGVTGATGSQGEPGQSSNYYSYKVHTTTQTPPTGDGEIRYNNATQTSSTVLYLDHLDNTGDDIDIFLSLLKQNDNLIIQDASDSNNYQTWRITSAPTVILNDYTSIPVTGITSAGTGTSGFSNNHSVLFIVFSSPIATAYVESFNGLTGAVTGVSTLNGQTGALQGVSSFNGATGAITFFNYVASFNGLTGAVTGVASVNGSTGAVTAVSSAVAGTGISVSGATGAVTITNTGVQSFNGRTGALQGVSSFNGATGAVTFTNYVASFNGLTGAVTGVTTSTANTFTALNTFNSGISAAGGATFSGTFSGITGSFSKLLTASSGLSASGATFSGNISASSVYASDNIYVNNRIYGYVNQNNYIDFSDGTVRIGDAQGNDTGQYIYYEQGENTLYGNGSDLSFQAGTFSSTVTVGNTVTVVAGGAVLEWDGSLPAPTVLSVYNSLTLANTLTLSAGGVFSTLNTNGTLQYGAAGAYSDAFSVTTATTGVTTMGSWTKTAYRSFEFDIQGSKGTTGPYQFTKILAVHDGTSATSTQLSNISTGATLGTYTVDISGTLLRLRVTPGATTSTVFKTIVKAIPV